jgi:pimeloyl-ACP methyl ester carboxylesterase
VDIQSFVSARQYAQTRFGRIAYVSRGCGPVAIFLHGVPLNGLHWREVLSAADKTRRCIAVDLMGLGATQVSPSQDLTFPEQAQMVLALADTLGVDQFDLVGNDSGGAIAQIIAVTATERLRSLTLTNCDCHDNWPPPAFEQAYALAKFGKLADAMAELLDNLPLAQSDLGLGTAYENPSILTRELVAAYIGPLVADDERRTLLNRYVASMDNRQTVRIEAELGTLKIPTQIIWGTEDVFFPLKSAYWLKKVIPGATRVVEATGARLFFAEERPQWFAERLVEHWKGPASIVRVDGRAVERRG